MPSAYTQCTVEGREEVEGQRKNFMFKCFFSGLKYVLFCHNIS